MLLHNLFQILSWVLFSRGTVVFPSKQKPPTHLFPCYLLYSTAKTVVRVSLWNEQDLCYKVLFSWYVVKDQLYHIYQEFHMNF